MPHNWGVLDNPEVVDIIEMVAQSVSYCMNVEVDDVIQEGYLLVSNTEGPLYEKAWHGGSMLGLLHYELTRDLMDAFKTEVRRRNKATSLEARNEVIESDEASFVGKAQAPRASGSTYNRELVELLLPAVWDEQYCYGVQQENAADPDMPRGSTNKATGNTLAAHLADIRIAWERAPLGHLDREVLLLTYGFDMTQRQIAHTLDISQPYVSTVAASAVGQIVNHLNGTESIV